MLVIRDGKVQFEQGYGVTDLRTHRKIDSDTKYMAANDAIEVALRPVPSANVFVPYQISIPTMAGSATIVSKRVEIVSPGKPQIAMLY